MRRDIAVESVLPYPIDVVWQALTDPAALADWVMPVEGFAPVVGQRFRFLAKPVPGWDGVINCEVLTVQAPERLVIRWQGSRMRGFEGPGGVLLALMHRFGWRRMTRRRLIEHLSSGQATR